MYVYLDEAGSIKSKGGERKYFVVTTFTTNNPKAVEVCLRRAKRNKSPKKLRRLAEIKASKAPPKYKRYFYQHLSQLDVEIYSVILDTKKAPKHLRSEEGVLYLHLVKTVLEQCRLEQSQTIHLFLDKRQLKGLTRESFNAALKERFSLDFAKPTRFEINHLDSTTNNGVQVADLIAHAVFQKYQHENSEWYDLIEERIKGEIIIPA